MIASPADTSSLLLEFTKYYLEVFLCNNSSIFTTKYEQSYSILLKDSEWCCSLYQAIYISKNILIASPYIAQFLKFLKFSTGRLENDFIDSKRLYLTLKVKLLPPLKQKRVVGVLKWFQFAKSTGTSIDGPCESVGRALDRNFDSWSWSNPGTIIVTRI